jgi:hypothetical protein
LSAYAGTTDRSGRIRGTTTTTTTSGSTSTAADTTLATAVCGQQHARAYDGGIRTCRINCPASADGHRYCRSSRDQQSGIHYSACSTGTPKVYSVPTASTSHDQTSRYY